MDNKLDSIKEMLAQADDSLGERASSINQKKQNIEMAAIDAILEIESLLESLSPEITLNEEKTSSDVDEKKEEIAPTSKHQAAQTLPEMPDTSVEKVQKEEITEPNEEVIEGEAEVIESPAESQEEPAEMLEESGEDLSEETIVSEEAHAEMLEESEEDLSEETIVSEEAPAEMPEESVEDFSEEPIADEPVEEGLAEEIEDPSTDSLDSYIHIEISEDETCNSGTSDSEIREDEVDEEEETINNLEKLQATIFGAHGADKLASIKEKDRPEQESVAQEKAVEKSYRSDSLSDTNEPNPDDPLDATINIDKFTEKPIMTINAEKQGKPEKPTDPLDVKLDLSEILGRAEERPVKKPMERPIKKSAIPREAVIGAASVAAAAHEKATTIGASDIAPDLGGNAEKPVEIPEERPIEKLTAKPTEKPIEKPAERPVEAPVEPQAEIQVEVPAERPAEVPAERPAEKPTEAPSKPSAANDFDAYAARLLKAAETGDESYLKEEPKEAKASQPGENQNGENPENAEISTNKATSGEEEKPKRKRTIQIDDEKSNPIKGVLMGLVTIVFIAAAAIAIILTFFPDSSVGYNINKLLGRGTATEHQGGNQGGQTPGQAGENQGEAEDPASKKAPTSNTIIGKAILSKIDLAEDIKRVEESGELRFVIEKDYGVEGITKAITFDDDIWYMSEHTENIHYTPELVGFVIDYYSKLYKRINKDDNAVLKLIVPDSKLMGDVSAIKKDAIVLHHLNKLEIGEIRRNGNDFYMMVRLSESTNDGKPDSQITRVLRMTTENKEIKMAEIVDAN